MSTRRILLFVGLALGILYGLLSGAQRIAELGPDRDAGYKAGALAYMALSRGIAGAFIGWLIGRAFPPAEQTPPEKGHE